jgi:hypothetical protein
MAKPARGLPEGFSLDLPDEGPVDIGDFLDEAPLAFAQRKPQKAPVEATPELPIPQQTFRPQIVPEREETVVEESARPASETDARVSEVFQGIVGLLHNAMDELDLAELPRRGAWGSVTAKNIPGALSELFERAIVQAAKKRSRLP